MNIVKNTFAVASVIAMLSCQSSGPKDIALGKDQCDNCRMTISALGYAAELVTDKGRAYKFDDIMCMNMYEGSNPDQAKNAKLYVVDYPTGKFLEKSTATFIKGGSIKSPMGGNTQAYQNKAAAQKAAAALGAGLTK